MSLTEIKIAAKGLSPAELIELIAFINQLDGATWDNEIEKDFSPDGKHHGLLGKIDATIESRSI